MSKKEFIIILILAVLVAGIAGYFFNFLFKLFEPASCVELLIYPSEPSCTPSKILWANALLDLAFWFVVLAAGWWVVTKWIRR